MSDNDKVTKIHFMKSAERKNRLLVVDADIVAYQSADGALEEDRVNDEEWQWTMNMSMAREEFADRIEDYQALLGANHVLLCFGSISNWRKRIFPEYKANRSQRKPLGYRALVVWASERWDTLSLPWLEADDLVGMCATGGFSDRVQDRTVVMVSEDKDFKSIPGLLYNPRRPEDGIMQTTLLQADAFHLEQALTGDPADNYKGCPGVGPKGAAKILGAWGHNHFKSPWAAIVDAYEKAGLTEQQALVQAQVARILRNGEYDAETGELFAWEPTA